MEENAEYERFEKPQWLKALIAILYIVVFLALFVGVFDRPNMESKEASPSGPQQAADLSGTALAIRPLEVETDGDSAPAAMEENAEEEELLPGDILLGRCKLSLVPSLNPHNGWTHVALFAGDDRLIVAGNPRSGVIETGISAWEYPKMTWVAYVRVVSADDETREKAVAFARKMRGQPYDLNWLSKQEAGESWYCSELVWAAYLYASGGSIDLARGPSWFGISPDDIYMHDETAVVGGHFEAKPDTVYSLLLKALAICILIGGLGIFVPHPIFSGSRRRRRG